MVDAALRDGTAHRESLFEAFARRLPDGRRYGIVAGTGRLLELIHRFRFEEAELEWLRANEVVRPATIDWLADYRFHGDIWGYREGEAYFPGSPLITIQATFAEAVMLETLVLSTLNYDSSVASAAARMVSVALGRPIAEMGSRRTSELAAVAAARAAYIAGFDATSNLEAGRTWGIPTMGTAAHAFTLLHDSEEAAFRAQVEAFGPKTTLLIDTYDIQTRRRDGRARGRPRARGRAHRLGRPAHAWSPRCATSSTTSAPSTRRSPSRATSTSSRSPGSRAPRSTPTASAPRSSPARASRPRAWSTSSSPVATTPASGWPWRRPPSRRRASAGARTPHGGSTPRAPRARSSSSSATVPSGEPEFEAGSELRPLMVELMADGVADPAFLGAEGTRAARAHRAEAMQELPIEAFRLGRGEPRDPDDVPLSALRRYCAFIRS